MRISILINTRLFMFLFSLSLPALVMANKLCKPTKNDYGIDKISTWKAESLDNGFVGYACILGKTILYRGDTRESSAIWESGFELRADALTNLSAITTQASWEDMLGVSSYGFTQNGISTALNLTTAKAYTDKYVYIIDSNGLGGIAIEATINAYKGTSYALGDEVLVIRKIPSTSIMGYLSIAENLKTFHKNLKYNSSATWSLPTPAKSN